MARLTRFCNTCHLAQRAGLSGNQEWLSFYWKSPMHTADAKPEHDLFIQMMKLKNMLRWLMDAEPVNSMGEETYN